MKTQVLALALTSLCMIRASAAERTFYVDLEPYENRKLDDNQGRGFDGNSLGQLPRGEQTLGDIKFQIGPGLIQLGSRVLSTPPASMDGIKVKERLSKLHILQAICLGISNIADGTEVGHYLVHYEDQSTERIPIVYGEDACDWFCTEGAKEPSKAKVVWKGDNEFATSRGCHLRLYASTWTNPKPDERVMRIDFVGRKEETQAAPLCLAMTAIQEIGGAVPDKDKEAEPDARNHLREAETTAIFPPDRRVPPSWQPQKFNGSVYYIIPLR